MSINFNPQVSSISANMGAGKTPAVKGVENKADFGNTIAKQLNNVSKQQNESNVAITDLLSGKSQDINSMVASIAKADMSFKLLVGVRNKLVEAYKETMKMQI